MSNNDGWGPLVVGVVAMGATFGAWHYYDIHEAYTEQKPRELMLVGTGYEKKDTDKGQFSYLVGNFVEKETQNKFVYPITQQTFDQYAETVSTLREPVMGHPYVPRQPLRMELNLSERDITPDKSKESALGYSIMLGILSALCFLILM